MRKYEFTGKTKNYYGVTLKQIKRISDGKIGGWIEKEENLSHDGDCWVSGNAEVYGDAIVYGNAIVFGNAIVYGNAEVYGDAEVCNGKIIKSSDYIVMKNNLTSGRYYTYNFTSDSWVVGCFNGETEKLKNHLESNGNELQKLEYGIAIGYVQKLKKIKSEIGE